MQSQSTRALQKGQYSPSGNSQEIPDGFLIAISAPVRKSRDGRPDQTFFDLAQILRNVILAKTAFMRPWSHIDWAREFELLTGQVGADRVKHAVAWFVVHIRDKYTPHVRSAKTFRERFGDIEEAIERTDSRRPLVAPETLSDATKFLLDRLTMVIWPKGVAEQLPAVVEQSVQNLTSWFRRMNRARLSDDLADHRRALLDLIGNTEHYLEKWFMSIWRRFHKWDDWTGNLGKQVWTPDHPDFVAVARQELEALGSEVKDAAPR